MTSSASDFIRDKWRQSFHFTDVNNDGVITSQDYEHVADYIAKATNASKEEALKTREEWMKWWRFAQSDPSVIAVSQERYMALCEELFQDVAQYKCLVGATATDLFDRIDLDKNGVISPAEFELFYKAYGREDKAAMLETFSKIDTNGDGHIQREEFIDDCVRFFTDPDPVSGRAYLYSVPEDTTI